MPLPPAPSRRHYHHDDDVAAATSMMTTPPRMAPPHDINETSDSYLRPLLPTETEQKRKIILSLLSTSRNIINCSEYFPDEIGERTDLNFDASKFILTRGHFPEILTTHVAVGAITLRVARHKWIYGPIRVSRQRTAEKLYDRPSMKNEVE